jgi:hypothetical protein
LNRNDFVFKKFILFAGSHAKGKTNDEIEEYVFHVNFWLDQLLVLFYLICPHMTDLHLPLPQLLQIHILNLFNFMELYMSTYKNLVVNELFGENANEEPEIKRTVREPWKWTHPNYVITIDRKLLDFKKIEIDPLQRMADGERRNNKLVLNW